MSKRHLKNKQTPNLQQTQLYDKVTRLQSQMLSQLEYLNKKRNNKFDCAHCYQQNADIQYDPTINYYQEFWKNFLINTICIKRYYDYKQYIHKINKRINNVQTIYGKRKKLMEPIDSKRRKRIGQIQDQELKCKICSKIYKDQASLEMHKNIKHNEQKCEHKSANLLEAKIQQLNEMYMENSSSQKNFYSQD